MDEEVTNRGGGTHDHDDGAKEPNSQTPTASEAAKVVGATRLGEIGGGSLTPGSRFGHYTIVRVIGVGGMGAVYEATQDSPRRSVALKVIRSSHISPQLLRRFEHESQVLGRLQHPGIAQVHEAGSVKDSHGDTVPFFAMELIHGVPLTVYATSKGLGTRKRLELVACICDALYHAHQKGVIHRDLKPGNILVDDSGQPKILDFGVARATDSDIQQTTMQTDIGELIGTVPYMSPEQVGGNPDELDTRSDVYALGVIAYELLAGRLPYDLKKKMIHEAVRVIREEEPTRLSSIDRTLRGDIETIVAHALEKDKTRRYQSAEALGSDIRRYLKDEPISARPASTWYQVAKFARRNKVLVGGIAATFVVLIAGIVGVSLSLQRALVAEIGLTKQIGETSRALAAARKAEGEARASEVVAETRLKETEQVAEFQGKMLSDIDTMTAGVELMKDIRQRFVAAMKEARVPEGEAASRTATFASELWRTNATDVAAAMIDRTILKPAVRAIDEQFKDQPLVDARLRQVLADRYQGLGLYAPAAALQDTALATRRSVLGDEHPNTLASINNTGLLLEAQGRFDEAEPFFRDALEKRRRLLGETHPDTLSSINNMGSVRKNQGKLSDAEGYFREALEKCRRTLGPEHSETLIILNNLGGVLQAQGKLGEAEPLFREAMETSRRTLGSEHLNTLGSISNIASLLNAQGKLAEADPYFREALEVSRRSLGVEHPHTLDTINLMGSFLYAQGKLSEAEQYFREAMELRRRTLGAEHPDTLTSINNVGFLLQKQGKLAEAEPFFREAMATLRRTQGAEHPFTLGSISNMAGLLEAQGRLVEAEPYFREVMETRRRTLGPDDANTLTSVNNLGAFFYAQGKLSAAEPYFREALDGRRRTQGAEHPETLTAICNMGFLLRDQGKLEEAEKCFREALEAAIRTKGAEHPQALLPMGYLGSLRQVQGRNKEAVELLVPLEGAYRKSFTGANARRLASLLEYLGKARAGVGEFGAAEGNILEAHAVFERTRGEAHKDTRRCVQAIVDLYGAWNAAEPGKGYDTKAAEWKTKLPSEETPKGSP